MLALAGSATAGAAEPAVKLGDGNWSYFSDPRLVASGDAVYTGWISTTGRVVVAKLVPSTGRHRSVVVGRTGVDDHNNPALLLRKDGRLVVFFSPHSGRVVPKGRRSRMYYRVARRAHSIAAWGPTHRVPVNAPGRLGYTYPNPIRLPGDRIWLAWRGGGWLPTFSIYRAGRWAPAREIVHGPSGQRPYAKYAAGPPGSGIVHIAFTEAHPELRPTHVRYVQYRLGRGFFHADGRRAGRLRDLPLASAHTDLVQPYREDEGRAWVMDVADDGHGNPVIVSSVGFGRRRQLFRSARWTGEGWTTSRITPAYATTRHRGAPAWFQTGGIVLDHRDPSLVYLSRVVRERGAIELWRTPDAGRTWARVERISPPGLNAYRPAAPITGDLRVVAYVTGSQTHWRRFTTAIRYSPVRAVRADHGP